MAAVAVDEAHCILFWGKKFREMYGELYRLRVLLGSGIPFIFLMMMIIIIINIFCKKYYYSQVRWSWRTPIRM